MRDKLFSPFDFFAARLRKKKMNLLSHLFEDDRDLRNQAKKELDRIDSSWRGEFTTALPQIMENVGDDNSLYCLAVREFGLFEDKAVAPPLVAIWKYEDNDVQKTAERILDQTAPSWRETLCAHAPKLVSALKDEYPHCRRTAAGLLGVSGDERATEALMAALKDENDDVRDTVVNALNRIDTHWLRNEMPKLISDLTSKNQQTQTEAANILGTIGDASAAQPLSSQARHLSSELRKMVETKMASASTIGMAFKMIKYSESNEHAIISAMKNSYFENAIEKIMKVNQPIYKNRRHLFCQKCCHREFKEIAIYRTTYVFEVKGDYLVICPICNSSLHFIHGISDVAGVIGGDMEALKREDDKIWVPVWNEKEKKAVYADIDSLIIRPGGVENWHLAVNAVILELAEKKTRRKKITICLEDHPPLPQDVIRMLKDFGRLKE